MLNSIPKQLYKYRAFNVNTLRMITEAEIYYADPTTFNDPLDSKPTIQIDTDLKSLEVLFYKLHIQAFGKEKAKEKIRHHRYMSTQFGNYKVDSEAETYYIQRLASEIKELIYKEFNKNGYLTSWTNYENNSEEIKTKNVFNYNKDNVKISETIYNKKSKVIFKRIVKLENNLALNITDYNENGKIETYSLNKLNESGQIIEQTQYKNIDKKQKKYTMSYEYNNCKILKYKILDNKGELFSETDYKYKNGKIIYNSSKDKSGLNTFTIERTEIEPNKFESTRRDKSGKITYKKVIWNDKFDNLIMEIQNLKDTLENIYTFDNKNNWITMKRFKNKKPIEIVVRNIEYYK